MRSWSRLLPALAPRGTTSFAEPALEQLIERSVATASSRASTSAPHADLAWGDVHAAGARRCLWTASGGVGVNGSGGASASAPAWAIGGAGSHRGLETQTHRQPRRPPRTPPSNAELAASIGQLSQPPAYSVEVEITAFEERYVDSASQVVQDLALINFAPKAKSVLAPGHRKAAPACGVVMAPERRDVPIDWRKTRFTLIRGPHIDKFGMEQFEQRRYCAVVTASTNEAAELHWLLEHLKLYEFSGVSMTVRVTSASYLTPSAPAAATQQQQQSAGAGAASESGSSSSSGGGGVLASHRAKIAHYLAPASALAQAEAAASTDSSSSGSVPHDAELRAALAALRGTVDAGLSARREALRGQHWFQDWHASARPGALAARPAAPEMDAAGEGDVNTELRGAAARDASAALSSIDAALLSLRFDAAEAPASYPLHIGTFAPGSGSVPAAQWMHAVLKYGQYQAKLNALSQEAVLLRAYSSYSLFAHTLLYTLLKLWVQSAVVGAKPFLALPSAAEAEAFMAKVKEAQHRGGGRGSSSGGQRTLFGKPGGADRS